MSNINKVISAIKAEEFEEITKELYGDKAGVCDFQRQRYLDAVNKFEKVFDYNSDISIFSTPGRTEVGGNHTDHNAGRVLAAAVDLDAIAVAAKNLSDKVRIYSEGYCPVEIDLKEMDIKQKEKNSTVSLVRGVCARLKELGFNVDGFDAYVTSNVLKGSGLSSSAAFEVLMVTVINHFFNDAVINDVLNAQISQYAENKYFGKPCGLMDQTTCAIGGFVTIDFNDFDNPVVKKVDFNFAESGYAMIIVDTGGNHADLNDDYEALENEMKKVARELGGEVLREFTLMDILSNIAYLRTKVNDRAILRAFHFQYDNDRVVNQVDALINNNFQEFLNLIIKSGENSWMLCQNCYSHNFIEEQGISIALAASEKLLQGRGAWRVHGGGFAGTIQAFVPKDFIEEYLTKMEKIFGENACHELYIRPTGTIKVL